MLRYKVSPKLRDEDGTICLGCDRGAMDEITHVNLGRLSEQGSRPKVVLGLGREIVTGIFGQRGSGKSYTLGTIIEALGASDARANIGFNVNDRAVLLLDTLNIYQYAVVPVSKIPDESLRNTLSAKIAGFELKETDISIRTYYPEGHRQGFYTGRYEPFALDTSLIRPEDYGHIFEIDLFKDPTGHLLLAAFDAVKNTGYSYDSESRRGKEEAGLSELIEYLSDESNTVGSFENTTVRALRSRLQTLARDKLFSSTPTPVSSMIKAGEVTILLLAHLAPPMRSLTAAILVRQLFNLRSVASEANKTLRLDSTISDDERAAAQQTIDLAPATHSALHRRSPRVRPAIKGESEHIHTNPVCEGRQEPWPVADDYIPATQCHSSGDFVAGGLCGCPPANGSIGYRCRDPQRQGSISGEDLQRYADALAP